jgi:predicted RNase H-like HicB family nuclease
MQRVQVLAQWDPDAGVWWAESANLPGLVTEAPTPDRLRDKLQAMVPDLLSESPDLASQFDGIHIVYERQDDLALA